MKFFICLFITIFISTSGYSNTCSLEVFDSSLGPLTCNVEENIGDCSCYAKKFNTLADEKKRLQIVNEKLGEAALKSIEQSFSEVAHLAQVLSESNIDFMSGGSNVLDECRLDSLGDRVINKCGSRGKTKKDINSIINKRLGKYFNSSRKIKNLTDLSNHIMNTFKNQIPMKIDDVTKSNQCLSSGEIKKIDNISDDALFVNNFEQLFDDSRKLISWDSLSKEEKTQVSKDPILKIFMQNNDLRKLATGTSFKKVKALFNNNTSLVKNALGKKCKNSIDSIATLLCKDPANSNVENKTFNARFFNYDPDEFSNGYNAEDAEFLAEVNDVETEDILESHVSYCVAKMCNINNNCNSGDQSKSRVDDLLDMFTYETGDSAFEKDGSVDKSNYELEEYNSYCSMFFCENNNEVIQEKASCKFKQPPHDISSVQKIVNDYVGKECSDEISKKFKFTLNYEIINCDSNNKYVVSNKFKSFLKVFKEKEIRELKYAADETDKEGDSKKTSSELFNHFVKNFEGDFGKVVKESKKSGKPIKIEQIIALKDSKPITSQEIRKITVSNQQPKSKDKIESTTVETGLNNKVSKKTNFTTDDKSYESKNKKINGKPSVQNQMIVQGAGNKQIPWDNDYITKAQHEKYMKELDSYNQVRERMAGIEGQLNAQNLNDDVRKDLIKEYKKLGQEEANLQNRLQSQLRNRNSIGSNFKGETSRNSYNSSNQQSNQYANYQNSNGLQNPIAGQGGGKPLEDDKSAPSDKSGIAELPGGGSGVNAENSNGRSLASLAGNNSRGNSSDSGITTNDLPYTDKEAEGTDPKVIKIEKLDNEIDIAKLLREKGITLDLGMHFELEYAGLKIKFIPERTKTNDKVKYVYIAKPIGKEAKDLLKLLVEAPYWDVPVVRASGFNNILPNQ